MLIKWFISHQWKQAFRSPIFQKNLVVNIFLGLIAFILFLEFLVAGIYIGDHWHEIFPNDHPVTKFNSYLLYYFAFDLILRFFMQSLPVMKIQPYLHLPIKKSSILHYLLGKAFLNFFNFFPLLIVIPIAAFQVSSNYSAGQAWIWVIAVFISVLSMNYLMVYLKRQWVGKPAIIGFFGLILIGLVTLDHFKVVAFSELSSYLFNAIILSPVYIVIPIGVFLLIYYINYAFLKANMYPEEIAVKKSKKVESSDFKYLKSFGKIGEMMGLEFRLYLRHKRTKSMLYMTPLFIFYGFIFYPNPEFKDVIWIRFFIGWFITGGLMYNYLVWAFAYESNYFDALLGNNIDMTQYFKMKFTLAVIISSACFVITIPYVFFDAQILLINFCMYLYSIGGLSFALLYMATFNKLRLDLSKGAAFNYQGMGASNWLAMVPAMLVPILLYIGLDAIGLTFIGTVICGIMGVLGLLFHKTLLELLVKQFNKRKYIMAEGFRKR